MAQHHSGFQINKGERASSLPALQLDRAWTSWQHIYLENISEIKVPLHLAAERPAPERDGMLMTCTDDRITICNRARAIDQSRWRLPQFFRLAGRRPVQWWKSITRKRRWRLLEEMLVSTASERQGRMTDHATGRLHGAGRNVGISGEPP